MSNYAFPNSVQAAKDQSELSELKKELEKYKAAYLVLKEANDEIMNDVLDNDNKNYSGKWFRESRRASKKAAEIFGNSK